MGVIIDAGGAHIFPSPYGAHYFDFTTLSRQRLPQPTLSRAGEVCLSCLWETFLTTLGKSPGKVSSLTHMEG